MVTFSWSRVSQVSRAHPPEVLHPADQDPDVLTVHRGVLLRQRPARLSGVLRRVCPEGRSEVTVRASHHLSLLFLFFLGTLQKRSAKIQEINTKFEEKMT